MSAAGAQFIEVGPGPASRRIAVLKGPAARQGCGPGLIWLPGFRSTMIGTKADALAAWAVTRGLSCTRFDYSGHGRSDGKFEDGTIGGWLDEAEAVFAGLTSGPQILVGSSMGGWISLLLLRRLIEKAPDEASRIEALVLIAPAWDMSEALWQAAPEQLRDELRRSGVYLRPSAYGDGPYPITMKLIEEGRNHLIKGHAFDPGRRVEIIHGRRDPDVPYAHSLELQKMLPGGHIHITEVPDGEHRLSRPQDLELLFSAIEATMGDAAIAGRAGRQVD